MARTSAVTAGSVLPTTITPEVSLSSRCTMPARGSARGPRVARQQAVEQGARPVARRRVHHQAGRLVQHQQVVVFVQHRQAPSARGRKARLSSVGTSSSATRWPARTLRDAVSAHRAVDPHMAALDQLLQVAARELRRQRHQHLVQALAMLGRCDGDAPSGLDAGLDRRPRLRAAPASTGAAALPIICAVLRRVALQPDSR